MADIIILNDLNILLMNSTIKILDFNLYKYDINAKWVMK